MPSLFLRSAPPRRLVSASRVHLFAAAGAGTFATILFLLGYYGTLSWLPRATGDASIRYPVTAWAERFDFAQFFGTIILPSYPTHVTWWIGFAMMFGALAGTGLLYALLLSWMVQRSDAIKGLGIGLGMFLGLGFLVTTANGFQTAVMRNTVPDTGLFLLGWSPWATIQLLILCVIYGVVLGTLYRAWTNHSHR